MSEPRQNARVTKPGCTVAVPKDLIETDPDRITWAVVSTIKAPLRDVLRFVAYYLDLGAQHLYLYLDEPDAGTARILGGHDQISLVQCDDAYWTDKPKKARETHQLRQAFNATRCYGRCDQMWVAHFDVDEFLLPTQPLHHELAAVPANAAYARVQPAELLAQPDPYSGPAHFKPRPHWPASTRNSAPTCPKASSATQAARTSPARGCLISALAFTAS